MTKEAIDALTVEQRRAHFKKIGELSKANNFNWSFDGVTYSYGDYMYLESRIPEQHAARQKFDKRHRKQMASLRETR